MKKSLIVAGTVSAIGLASLAGAGFAYAASDQTNPQDGLVSAIASKFNLDKADVQKVFDEQHAAMDEEREREVKDELALLVKDGKLTQAQSDAITVKRAALHEQREAIRTSDQSKSHDEMKSHMQTQHAELKTWAKEQGIDAQYLRYVFGHGSRGYGGFGNNHSGTRGDKRPDGSTTRSSTAPSPDNS